jgi:hypothetical protein
MDNIYTELQKAISEIKSGNTLYQDVFSSTAFDGYLSKTASEKPTIRKRITSMRQLSSFTRVSEDTLIHKCEKDLWRLTKDSKGNDVIEKLYDEDILKY